MEVLRREECGEEGGRREGGGREKNTHLKNTIAQASLLHWPARDVGHLVNVPVPPLLLLVVPHHVMVLGHRDRVVAREVPGQGFARLDARYGSIKCKGHAAHLDYHVIDTVRHWMSGLSATC